MATQLDPRHRQILRLAVESYVQTAQPVSSGAVAKQARDLDASPATIRSVMAELEGFGLLVQPHASAGRIPTERGLRIYLDGLMNPKLRPWDRTRLAATTDSADQQTFPNHLGEGLAGLAGQVAVVSVPRFLGTRFSEIGLARCGNQRLLAFFVTPSGLVQQKIVSLDFDLSDTELQRIQNFLNERLSNRTLSEVRKLVQEALEREPEDHPWRAAWLIGQRALPAEGIDLIVAGTSHLAAQPEFSDVRKLRGLLEAFEQRVPLLELLDRVLDHSGVRVLLGSEHDIQGVSELSCVAGTWNSTAGHGTISLVGPRRMDYGRLVPLVGYASELLGQYWKTI